jgi:hypothetical protein
MRKLGFEDRSEEANVIFGLGFGNFMDGRLCVWREGSVGGLFEGFVNEDFERATELSSDSYIDHSQTSYAFHFGAGLAS